jgi:formamidopyrimidine-DNA glycosylase
MIEYPEAATLARQIEKELSGARITTCVRGNSPHKFAFYTYEPEGYAQVMVGAKVGAARVEGSHALVQVGTEHTLALGGGGEKVLLHAAEVTLPAKHQLLLGFEDGRYLSVTVQGWGAIALMNPDELAAHPWIGKAKSIPPFDPGFTPGYFKALFAALPDVEKRSVKYFIISDPQIYGVGNGYLQDILFRARVNPRRRAVQLSESEQLALYDSIRTTLRSAVDLGGRDTESDLYGRSGGYVPLMDKRLKGQPCPVCGTLVVKEAYLGGSVYYCPSCQPV